ncbi:unnamed protein product [Bathycoccus prasinos]
MDRQGASLALKILEAMSRECEKSCREDWALWLRMRWRRLKTPHAEKTKEEKRELAKRKREQMLREMEMKTANGGGFQLGSREYAHGNHATDIIESTTCEAIKQYINRQPPQNEWENTFKKRETPLLWYSAQYDCRLDFMSSRMLKTHVDEPTNSRRADGIIKAVYRAVDAWLKRRTKRQKALHDKRKQP